MSSWVKNTKNWAKVCLALTALVVPGGGVALLGYALYRRWQIRRGVDNKIHSKVE